MKKTKLTIFFLILVSQISFGEAIYPLFETSRIQGFGGAGAAIVRGEEAIFYNPSLINYNRKHQQISLVSPLLSSTDSVFDLLLYPEDYKNLNFSDEEILEIIEEKNFFLSAQNNFGFILDKSAFGILSRAYALVYFDGDRDDLDDLEFRTKLVFYNAVYYGLSRKVGKNFDVGFLVKLLYKIEENLASLFVDVLEEIIIKDDENIRNLSTKSQGPGVGLDLGLTYTLPKENFELAFSLVAQNIFGQHYFGENAPEDEKTIVNLGVGYTQKIFETDQKLLLALDFKDFFLSYESKFFKKVHLGLMWKYKKFASVSFGLNQGYPTAGFSLSYKIFEIGISRYSVELGRDVGLEPSVRTSIMGRIGWTF